LFLRGLLKKTPLGSPQNFLKSFLRDFFSKKSPYFRASEKSGKNGKTNTIILCKAFCGYSDFDTVLILETDDNKQASANLSAISRAERR